MYPPEFEYDAPKSLNEALKLLGGKHSDSRILAGGQSIIPMLKLRTAQVKGLVDITRIKELDYVKIDSDFLKIGALTTISTLEHNKDIAGAFPIINDAAKEIADPLVRNMGTIGGNLCLCDPVNDMPAVVLALDATLIAANSKGERRISAEDFFVDLFKNSLKDDELLKEIEIPMRKGVGASYLKIKKDSGGFTIAGIATAISLNEDKTVKETRIAMTGVGPKSIRAKNAEAALIGADESSIDKAAELAINESSPFTDLDATDTYRMDALGKLVKDSLALSFARAKGSK